MKTSLRFLPVSAAIGIALTPPAFPASGDPVGFEFLTIHADGWSLLGERIQPPLVAIGSVTSASGADVTDTGVDFDSALDPGTEYIIEFETQLIPSVEAKVVDVVSHSGNTLTLAESGVAPVDANYRVRPKWRLSDLYSPVLIPDLNPAEDFDPETGDLFLTPDGNGGYREYFYSSNTGYEGFYNAATGEAEDPWLKHTEALLVLRRGASTDLVITGDVKVTDTWIPLSTRFSAIGAESPVATLADTGLDVSLQSGTASTADLVWSQDTITGEIRRYFHSDGSGAGLTTGWRLADPPPGDEDLEQGDEFVSPGLLIHRRGSLPHPVVIPAPLITP